MRPAGDQPSPRSEVAKKILRACGLDVVHLRPLPSGAQSSVWEARTRQRRFVLRISSPRPGEETRYEAEFAIRKALFAAGHRVSRPIMTNLDLDTGLEIDWCLDEFVDGRSPGTRQLPQQICGDIGEVLAALHSLPVEGHGFLQNRRDRLVGENRCLRDGLLSRLERPWPFTGEPIENHPIANEAPDLVEKLKDLKPSLLALLDLERHTAAIHTDLHNGQLPVSKGRLAALLDFGDAVAGPPAWDIGSFAYYHDWSQAGCVLDAYTADPARRAELLEAGRMFAIVIALHHAGRSGLLGEPHCMSGAIRYLRGSIA